MNSIRTIALAVSALAAAASCTEKMNVELGSVQPRIVVYGQITTDTTSHLVRVTQTADYFSNATPGAIPGATLSITDGVNVYPLTESTTEPGSYYTQPGVYGEPGKTYTLTAQNVRMAGDGEAHSLTARCAIPLLPPNYQTNYLDSISVLYTDQQGGWLVNGWAKEPENQRNFYMFRIYINDVLYSDSLDNIVVSDDRFVNEGAVNGLPLYFIDEPDTLKPGYRVTLELSVITEDYFKFIGETQTGSQPQIPVFTPPPANARTNISNGAIGFFSAHAVIRHSYIIRQADVDRKSRLMSQKGR